MNIDNWTTQELFDFCIVNHIIYPLDDFEEWEDDREYMIKIVKDYLDGRENRGKFVETKAS